MNKIDDVCHFCLVNMTLFLTLLIVMSIIRKDKDECGDAMYRLSVRQTLRRRPRPSGRWPIQLTAGVRGGERGAVNRVDFAERKPHRTLHEDVDL